VGGFTFTFDVVISADPAGEIFDSPLDVTFHDISVLQPDLFYVPGEQKAFVKDVRVGIN
jgi:hypothetical protein